MRYSINCIFDKKDAQLLDFALRDVLAFSDNDDWSISFASRLDEFLSAISCSGDIDISCLDITKNGAIEAAESLRKNNPVASLVLITDPGISPLLYMKPSIMACSLIMKPVKKEEAAAQLQEVLYSYLQPVQDTEKRFCIQAKDGNSYYSFDKILYFEAREKKIFLNTIGSETGFYTTLDVLQNELPEYFIRCHRGFIVNKLKISKVSFSDGVIYLNKNVTVPMSRGFKENVRLSLEEKR